MGLNPHYQTKGMQFVYIFFLVGLIVAVCAAFFVAKSKGKYHFACVTVVPPALIEMAPHMMHFHLPTAIGDTIEEGGRKMAERQEREDRQEQDNSGDRACDRLSS